MTQQTKNKGQSKWIYIGSASLLLGLLLAYFVLPGFQDFIHTSYQILSSGDRQRISEYVQGFGAWGPAIIIVTMVVQMFLIVVPSWLLMIVAVLAYGAVRGAALSIVAVFVASTIGYFLGKMFNTVTISRLVGQKQEKKMERFLDKYGFGAVFLFRLAPFLSNDAISFVGGLLSMGYWRFIGATLAGIIPLSALIGYFGQDTEKLRNGLIWIGGGSLVLYLAYVVWDYWFRKEQSDAEE